MQEDNAGERMKERVNTCEQKARKGKRKPGKDRTKRKQGKKTCARRKDCRRNEENDYRRREAALTWIELRNEPKRKIEPELLLDPRRKMREGEEQEE